jgi:hypothetical protein
VTKVIERNQAHYDVQEMEFGTVYRWQPESVLIECKCGEMVALTLSKSLCEECGAEHAKLVREIWTASCRRTKPYAPGATPGIDHMPGSLSEEGS